MFFFLFDFLNTLLIQWGNCCRVHLTFKVLLGGPVSCERTLQDVGEEPMIEPLALQFVDKPLYKPTHSRPFKTAQSYMLLLDKFL